MGLFTRKTEIVAPDQALPGRDTPIVEPGRHLVLGTPIGPPFPDGTERAIFGMGCFWGAERMFWRAPGIFTTAVGYSAGFTPNPTDQKVCTGMTGKMIEFYKNNKDDERNPSNPTLAKGGKGGFFNKREFKKTLLPCRLQRHMQALGAYGFLSRVKGKKYFLKYVPEALRLLKEDVSLSKKEYPQLYNLVMRL